MSTRIRVILAAAAVGLGSISLGCAGYDSSVDTAPSGPSGPHGVILSQLTSNPTAGMADSAVDMTVHLADSTRASMAGELIFWAIQSGGGSAGDTSRTDQQGYASMRWTLGTVVGVQALRASYGNGSSAYRDTRLEVAVSTNPRCAGGRRLDTPGGLGDFSHNWDPAMGPRIYTRDIYSFDYWAPLTIMPGTTVCLGPGVRMGFGGGRTVSYLEAVGTAQSPIIITAMGLHEPWGELRFAGLPPAASHMEYVQVEHGNAIVTDSGHPLVIANATITGMGSNGVRLFSPNSTLLNSSITGTQGFGAILGTAGAGTILFAGRVTGSGGTGISLVGPGVQLINCEVTANAGAGVAVHIAALSGLASSIHNCNVHSNGAVEIGNLSPTDTVDATQNWWGTSGGLAGNELSGLVNASAPLASPVVLGY